MGTFAQDGQAFLGLLDHVWAGMREVSAGAHGKRVRDAEMSFLLAKQRGLQRPLKAFSGMQVL